MTLLPNRRSIRLKGYDYSKSGLYFITVCTDERKCFFGEIKDGTMLLSMTGEIVKRCWENIPEHFPNVVLLEYVIMPNHIHGIIRITDVPIGAKDISPLPEHPAGTSKTVGSIIRGFKIGVTKEAGYSPWQRNYYEHIIRNESSYNQIAEYIVNNPVNWQTDCFVVM